MRIFILVEYKHYEKIHPHELFSHYHKDNTHHTPGFHGVFIKLSMLKEYAAKLKSTGVLNWVTDPYTGYIRASTSCGELIIYILMN